VLLLTLADTRPLGPEEAAQAPAAQAPTVEKPFPLADALHAIRPASPAPSAGYHESDWQDAAHDSNDSVAAFAALQSDGHENISPARTSDSADPDGVPEPTARPARRIAQVGRKCSRLTAPLCETWGGNAGFSYADATPNARAAFRAVVRRHARKGDSVLLSYTPSTEAMLPQPPSEKSLACDMWARIDLSVDSARCVAEPNYLMAFVEEHNHAHYVELMSIIQESDYPPRLMPATVHLDDVDTSYAVGRMPASFEGGEEGSPYLRVLRDLTNSGGLSHLVRALSSQCELDTADQLY